MQKSILITGASTGIGRTMTEMLDKKGFRIFAGVRKEADAISLKENCSSNVIPVILDVTKPKNIESTFSQVDTECGDAGLYGVINNAGIVMPGALEFVPLENVHWQLEVNLYGVIRVNQAFIPLLRKWNNTQPEKARIINIGSIGGRNAFPFMGLYNISKFALLGYSEALRYELSLWDIYVSLIEPGAILTPIWEKGEIDFENSIQNLPPKGKDLYEYPMTRFKKMMRTVAEKGITPEAASKIVVNATIAKKPKNRYLVGLEAKITAKLVKFLPDHWRFSLISSQIGLQKDPSQKETATAER